MIVNPQKVLKACGLGSAPPGMTYEQAAEANPEVSGLIVAYMLVAAIKRTMHARSIVDLRSGLDGVLVFSRSLVAGHLQSMIAETVAGEKEEEEEK